MKIIRFLLTWSGASALGLATVGAGCSSSEVIAPLEAAVDAPIPPKPPRDASGDDAGQCPLADPPAPGSLPWKPPTPPRSDCTLDDYNALDQYLKTSTSATTSEVAAFVAARNSACHDCIFTDASKATWGPVPMQGGQLVTINIGGCFAIVANSEACGQDIQNDFDCEYDSCALCADEEFDACRTKAQKTLCASFVAKESADCAGAPSNVNDLCGSFMRSVKVQCVADADAGDAAVDAPDGD